MPDYPFVPKTNANLAPGQFWSIPLSDGRFACGRVLAIDRGATYGARTAFVGGLLDWVGTERPSSDSIAGKAVLEVGTAHVRVIAESGGAVLGERALELDGISVPADVRSAWGLRYPALRAEHLFVAGNPPPEFERRDVNSPLTEEMLKPSVTGRGVVQFKTLLTDADLYRLSEWLRQYPEMTLRAYGSYDGSIRDLEFLSYFRFLRRFGVDAVYHSLESLDGLRHLPEDAEELTVGWTKRALDLSILGRFRFLRTLYIEGQTKNIGVISRLSSLEDLTLRSITLPDLSLLVPLHRLLSLDIKLGGTKDLNLLPRVGTLRYLELWLIKGLSDISAVGELPQLRYLFLQALKQVDRLPDLSKCVALRRVHLETMKGLGDLKPLATAPTLEQVVLIDMPHLKPEDLRPLVGLPQLKAVSYGLGSLRKRNEARALLGLPEVESTFDWRED
jgi:hypothetical protein